MTPRRRAALGVGLALVVLGVLGAACGGGSQRTVAPRPRTTTSPPSPPGATSPATAAPTTSTVPPGAAGVTLNVYFLRDDRIGTAHRRVPPTRAVARTALEQLLAGPTAGERAAGLRSEIPDGTRLLDVRVADGVATVDLSGEFQAGGGPRSLPARLAQVVFTLTQFPTVEGVAVLLDGRPLTSVAGMSLPDPMRRSDFAAMTPLILVESPAPGDVVSSPLRVAGLNNTFEATVRIRIEGSDGRTLADTFTTGQGGTGTWGPFEARVTFDRGRDERGTVVVFEDSPEDGSEINVVEIPVRFA